MHHRIIPSFIAAAAILVACGDNNDGTGPIPQCRATSVSVIAPTSLEVGASVQAQADLMVTAACQEDPPVSWKSSDNGIATVSTTGRITGVAAGTVIITATAADGAGSATITVTRTPVAGVAMSSGNLVVGVGNAGKLTATPMSADDTPLPGRTVTWSSSNPGVATVVEGIVTGVSTGNVTITATSEGMSTGTPVRIVAPQIAYAWNHSASAPPGTYEAAEFYRYMTSGTGILFDRPSTGIYGVVWEGFTFSDAATSATFISPYGAAGVTCRPTGWSPIVADIRCFNGVGPADTRFTVLTVTSGTMGGRSAFAWVSNGDASSNSSSGWTHHPHGLPVYSERTGTGSYMVHFPGLGRASAADREAVLVNAYGANTHCQSGNPTTHGDTLRVAVHCFDLAGTPSNSQYTVLLVDQARPGGKLAFAVNENPNSASYQPANAAVRPNGSLTINRLEVGYWRVDVTDFSRGAGLTDTWMVVANGSVPAFCSVDNWSDTSVRVRCATTAGAAIDVPFTVIGVQ